MLSSHARAFLASAPSVTESFNLTMLAERRHQNLARYREGSLQALADNSTVMRESTLAGIPCTEVAPAGTAADLTIFFCFGGGFVTGSPFEEARILAPLARLSGARVLCPAYRLAPEHPFPAALDDLERAWHAAQAQVLVGESAGGNLALSLLARLGSDQWPRAVALLSPWCDLAGSGDSLTFNAGRDPTLQRDYLQAAARAYAGGRGLADAAISPLYTPFPRSLPPVMITTGTRDLLLSDSVRLAHRLRRSGTPVSLHVWEELWHVFEFYNDIPESRESLAEIAAFLRRGCAQAGR